MYKREREKSADAERDTNQPKERETELSLKFRIVPQKHLQCLILVVSLILFQCLILLALFQTKLSSNIGTCPTGKEILIY